MSTTTNNPFIDQIVETQTNFINNWVDSARKIQSAFSNGNIASEGQSIYKEWLDKQMNILNSMKSNTGNLFSEATNNNPQEFFRNWFNQQAGFTKQMADFNQSIFNSFSNFGKPANEYMQNFGQMNTAFTNIYNAWIHTLNASYDNLSKNLGESFNKDVFGKFMQGNNIYAKMQEFFQPAVEAFQKGQFNYEAFKNHFTAENYQNLTKQIFGDVYNGAPMKEVYDNGIKQIQHFFAGQHNLNKEYFEQFQNMSKEFPQLFSGNFEKVKELYSQVNNVFGKTFEPLMKVVSPGKEKERIEDTINLMDKIAEYSVRQAELQAQLQATTQKSIEKVAKQLTEKYNVTDAAKQLPTAQELYNEWIKVNEQLFTELFASEEFSKIKGEALNLSMDVKKQFQKIFEHTFENFPLVFKSEVEDLHKTIYDLKKQVKDLQSKLGTAAAENEEDKAAKAKKK
jgi:class III poly(R)-hydroxyalkanoic acid synthase PhaE subunit